MAMEDDFLEQKAVYWEATGDLDDEGRQTVNSPPVEISCRWEEAQREFINGQGESVAVEATVYLDQAIPIGSILWKGELTDLPDPETDLKVVVLYGEIPDIKGEETLRYVYVQRFGDSLPTLGSA